MATIKVKALKNFGYPGSVSVRNEIREWHGASGKKNIGKVFPDEDRGLIVEVVAGELISAPEDLLDSWLAAELVVIPLD